MRTPQEWAELYEEAIVSLVSGGVSSYSIAGRSFTKHDIDKLTKLHEYWSDRYEAKRRNTGFVTVSDLRAKFDTGVIS